MTGLVSEGESSSSTAEESSTTWINKDVELPGDLSGPDNMFFQYIERLMADSEEGILSPNKLNIIEVIDFKGSSDYIDKFYQVDKDDVNDNAEDGRRISQATRRDAVDNPRESARRRRFFGIYERVKVKFIWEKLMRLGVVRRSKKLSLMDISATTSIELNYGQEV